jgi:hypothetical protein
VTGSRYGFPVISIALVCTLAAVFGWTISGQVAQSDSMILAFPSSVQEEIVIQSLARVGIDRVAGATNTLVPLSDFSQVALVPFLNANSRVREGDPRQTPFLDELRSSFSIAGADKQAWSCIYMKLRGETQSIAAAGAIEALTSTWAWNLQDEKRGAALLWLPGLVWLLWLVAGKPKRARFCRAIIALAWLPLLFGATIGSALLFIILLAASLEAHAYRAAGRASFALRTLWLYALASIVIVVFDHASIPLLALSLGLYVMAYRYGPRLVLLAGRRRLHAAPAFIALTASAPQGYARDIRRTLVVPLAAVLLLSILVPGKTRLPINPPYRIVQGVPKGSGWARELLASHIAFQEAITFGRIGDADREDGLYVPAYRYREEDGRMRRYDDTSRSEEWPSDVFTSVIDVLSEAKPMSIIESALP